MRDLLVNAVAGCFCLKAASWLLSDKIPLAAIVDIIHFGTATFSSLKCRSCQSCDVSP